jgi:hypothetical protein
MNDTKLIKEIGKTIEFLKDLTEFFDNETEKLERSEDD